MHTDGPVRTCAACRTRRSQGALMRVVRRPTGDVLVDIGRKRADGRGVYLCRVESCINIAVQRQTLRRSLGVPVAANVYDDLRALLKSERHVTE